MERLGKNIGRYYGDTIDIQRILARIEIAASKHGWISETFFEIPDLKLFAFGRRPSGAAADAPRIYLSAGIHGDEPAGPLAALRLLEENRWPAHLDLRLCPCLN